MVIAPYFLSRGRHIQEDIPALVREAQAQHPGLQCIIAQPIGEKGYQSGEGGGTEGSVSSPKPPPCAAHR